MIQRSVSESAVAAGERPLHEVLRDEPYVIRTSGTDGAVHPADGDPAVETAG